MRRTRGLSMAVTAALLILVSIALVAALWLYSTRFTSGGSVVQASANLISNRWVNNQPVYVADLAIQSKAQTRLMLKSINIIYTTKDGNTHTLTLQYQTGSRGGGSWQTSGDTAGITQVSLSPNTQIYIQPNSNTHVTLSMRGNANNVPVEMTFQLIFQDDAGNTYTAQTNTLQVG